MDDADAGAVDGGVIPVFLCPVATTQGNGDFYLLPFTKPVGSIDVLIDKFYRHILLVLVAIVNDYQFFCELFCYLLLGADVVYRSFYDTRACFCTHNLNFLVVG